MHHQLLVQTVCWSQELANSKDTSVSGVLQTRFSYIEHILFIFILFLSIYISYFCGANADIVADILLFQSECIHDRG